ncbi:FAD-dependent oxidoreductase [Deinococcus sp.]|uniref:FAD-dependent oxidoreductase n=1 Tax=Deinococcus sp. TaxID=47478 RepID=UPI003C7ED584
MTTHPRVTIIGAGPGGLLCARVLQRRGLEVSVYDADASADARNQGGTLDLHANMGQIALREAGLLEQFFALARPEGQAKRMMNAHGEVLMEHLPAEGEAAAPEIDRGQLRALLAASLVPGTVRWNHKLTSAEPLGGGVHRLTFGNGHEVKSDLVIGADGAWSRVRPLLSAAQPVYTGVTLLEAWFNHADERHPAVAEIVRGGHAFIRGDNAAMIAQRGSSGHIRVYIGLRAELDWLQAAQIDPSDTGAVRRALLERFAGWNPDLLTLIIGNDGPYIPRPLFVLPAPHSWPPTPGVTLLGDAAHLMSPFGGHGVNLALLDGSELALSLAHEPSVQAAVSAYERVMLPRAAELAVGANNALDEFFSAQAFGPEQAPDFDEEAERYKREAAAYAYRGSGASGQG